MKLHNHMLLILVAGLLIGNSAQGMATSAYKKNVKKVRTILNSPAANITPAKLQEADASLKLLEKGINQRQDPARYRDVQILRTQYNTVTATRGLSARDQVVADLRAKLVAINDMLDNAQTAAVSDQKEIIKNVNSTIDGFDKTLKQDLSNLKMTESQFFAAAGSLENDIDTALKRAKDLESEINSGSAGSAAGAPDIKHRAESGTSMNPFAPSSAEQQPVVPVAVPPVTYYAPAQPIVSPNVPPATPNAAYASVGGSAVEPEAEEEPIDPNAL